MRVTNIFIALKEEPILKGFATITFDDSVVLRSVRIVQLPRRDYLSILMPSKRTFSGQYCDIISCKTSDVRKYLTDIVLEAYDRKVNESNAHDWLNRYEDINPEPNK